MGELKWVSEELKMFRNEISTVPVVLIIFCLGGLTLSSCSVPNREVLNKRTDLSVREMSRPEESPLSQPPVAIEPLLNQKSDPQAKVVVEQPQPVNLSQTPNSTIIPEKSDSIAKSAGSVDAPGPILSSDLTSPDLSKKNETVKKQPVQNPSLLNFRDERRVREEETERDIMEEALLLLDESQKYWVNGELEDALQMLDQAYALLLDTNGNPDIMRQKDDLRLMISKRILATTTQTSPLQRASAGRFRSLAIRTLKRRSVYFRRLNAIFSSHPISGRESIGP
jgi:hypothetical protein